MIGKSIKMSMKELIKYASVPRKRDKKTHRPYILLAVVVIMMWLVGCKSTEKVVKEKGGADGQVQTKVQTEKQAAEEKRVKVESKATGISEKGITGEEGKHKGGVGESGKAEKEARGWKNPEILWVKGWNVLIYSNASYKSGVAGMVIRGDKLEALLQKGEWYKVRAGELEGWVKGKEVTNREVEGIKIRKKKLTSKKRKKVKELIAKAKKLKKEWKEFEKKFWKYYNNREVWDKGVDEKGEDIVLRHRKDLRRLRSYPGMIYKTYYDIYKEDTNNLEAMKGMIEIGDKIYIPEHTGNIPELKVDPIYLCNRALLLNPPDKEWWYRVLAAQYYNKHSQKYLFFTLKTKEILERKGKTNTNTYADILYDLADFSTDINVKKKYYEKLLKEYPNWNLEYPDRVNIKDIKRKYNRIIKSQKKDE